MLCKKIKSELENQEDWSMIGNIFKQGLNNIATQTEARTVFVNKIPSIKNIMLTKYSPW